MCGLTHDGEEVGGFRSALSCNFTTVSLQNDPEVFEVYISTQDRTGWFSLRQATAFSKSINAGDVTDTEAIDYLINNVDLQHIRYFYRNADDVLLGTETFSSGLTGRYLRHTSLQYSLRQKRVHANRFVLCDRSSSELLGTWWRTDHRCQCELQLRRTSEFARKVSPVSEPQVVPRHLTVVSRFKVSGARSPSTEET